MLEYSCVSRPKDQSYEATISAPLKSGRDAQRIGVRRWQDEAAPSPLEAEAGCVALRAVPMSIKRRAARLGHSLARHSPALRPFLGQRWLTRSSAVQVMPSRPSSAPRETADRRRMSLDQRLDVRSRASHDRANVRTRGFGYLFGRRERFAVVGRVQIPLAAEIKLVGNQTGDRCAQQNRKWDALAGRGFPLAPAAQVHIVVVNYARDL